MQETPQPDELLPLSSFVLHRNLRVFQFLDESEPLRYGSFKIVNGRRDLMYQLLTPDGITFHTQRNYLIPNCPRELLLSPHIQ